MVKTERSYPAPDSLAAEKAKASGSYRCSDVIDRLYKDFNKKCYICEMKDIPDGQVEHLHPHHNGKDIDKKFDWENLFLSCPHCNSVKNKDKYENKIIDCTKTDPEEYILFKAEGRDISISAKEKENSDEAEMTAELITEVFDLGNKGLRVKGTERRLEGVYSEMTVLYKLLTKYSEKKQCGNIPKSLLKQIEAVLKRETAYAAFKRCYVREKINTFPEFQNYIM